MSKLKQQVDEVDVIEKRVHFGASFKRRTLLEVDQIRGDTNRSLWLERLAIKELERKKKKEEEEREQQEQTDGVRGSQVTSHVSTNATPTPTSTFEVVQTSLEVQPWRSRP